MDGARLSKPSSSLLNTAQVYHRSNALRKTEKKQFGTVHVMVQPLESTQDSILAVD